jgi:hypothetical protein
VVRGFALDEALQRTRVAYLSELAREAWRGGGLWGAGWGGFGLPRFTPRLVGESDAPPAPMIEGGYAVVLFETGLPGLVLFLWMHLALLMARPAARGWRRAAATAVIIWSVVGNLPQHIQAVPVLAIPWWFLVGVCWGASTGRCASRSAGYP